MFQTKSKFMRGNPPIVICSPPLPAGQFLIWVEVQLPGGLLPQQTGNPPVDVTPLELAGQFIIWDEVQLPGGLLPQQTGLLTRDLSKAL